MRAVGVALLLTLVAALENTVAHSLA